jgi:hypothetical protein
MSRRGLFAQLSFKKGALPVRGLGLSSAGHGRAWSRPAAAGRGTGHGIGVAPVTTAGEDWADGQAEGQGDWRAAR